MASSAKKETEIRVNVDAEFLKELQDKLGVDPAPALAPAAQPLGGRGSYYK
jgi:hypothetical protein